MKARWPRVRVLRHVVLDMAPACTLVALFAVGVVLIPRLGGPLIDPPGEGIYWPGVLQQGAAWGIVALLVSLFTSRAKAVWRASRDGASLSPALAATRRTLVRVAPRVLTVVAGTMLIRLLMPSFIGFKRAIPEFHPYGAMDLVLMRVDRALHLGIDPWRWLHPLFGHAWATVAIDWVYILWYTVSTAGFATLVFHLRGHRRVQFTLAFASVWIFLGVGFATVMASVGPVYVDRLFGGESSFTPLMAYLHSVNEIRPLHALALQEQLWAAHATGERGLLSGISAMPSLHVAIPALFAVASWHRARWLSVTAWIYTGVIVLGSVHLGWHYAVDGYASIVLVLPVWWAAGVVAAGWHARTRAWRWGWPAGRLAERPSPVEPAATERTRALEAQPR
jgi:hypothetical protein